jgi:hypothetical protein
MTMVILGGVRRAPDILWLTVQREGDAVQYTFTLESTSVADVIDYDERFNLDFFNHIDQKISILEVVRNLFSGIEVEFPVVLAQ